MISAASLHGPRTCRPRAGNQPFLIGSAKLLKSVPSDKSLVAPSRRCPQLNGRHWNNDARDPHSRRHRSPSRRSSSRSRTVVEKAASLAGDIVEKAPPDFYQMAWIPEAWHLEFEGLHLTPPHAKTLRPYRDTSQNRDTNNNEDDESRCTNAALFVYRRSRTRLRQRLTWRRECLR